MSSFDNREKGFEKKFATEEELKFKINSRRNRYLGEWASGILQFKGEDQKKYIQSVVKADLEEAGDEDVIRKLKKDLENFNVTEGEIRNKISEFNQKAQSDYQ
ncbi:MAG: hypothetical protein CMI85_06605 [Candidatus Pelagibacter sp.]|nr:hypothetical protein [Candidatus Pelagibacter sp.]